jgi:hypothetical protein
MLSDQLRVDTQDHTLALAAVQLSSTGGTHGLTTQAHPTQSWQALPSALYLMGPWDEVQVDPRVWGFGKVGLLAYAVKAATQRLVQAQCRDVKGWVPGYGVRPRLWRAEDGSLSPATALKQLTSRQKRTFVQMMQQAKKKK